MEPYVPDYGFALSAEELAGGWLKEWFEGIEGTNVRPGFVKTGVNPGPLRPTSQKVFRAAAITSRHTGLAIACHTVKAVAALQCLDILEQEKVSPTRFIFVHAQGEENIELLAQCARRGAWIEFDGIDPNSAGKHLKSIRAMLDEGFESQILISQDAGWYRPGEPNGGEVRPFDFLFTDFVPSLVREGFPKATIDHLLEHNPRKAFAIAAT
jgi:phosphotriesterase-related protein